MNQWKDWKDWKGKTGEGSFFKVQFYVAYTLGKSMPEI